MIIHFLTLTLVINWGCNLWWSNSLKPILQFMYDFYYLYLVIHLNYLVFMSLSIRNELLNHLVDSFRHFIPVHWCMETEIIWIFKHFFRIYERWPQSRELICNAIYLVIWSLILWPDLHSLMFHSGPLLCLSFQWLCNIHCSWNNLQPPACHSCRTPRKWTVLRIVACSVVYITGDVCLVSMAALVPKKIYIQYKKK